MCIRDSFADLLSICRTTSLTVINCFCTVQHLDTLWICYGTVRGSDRWRYSRRRGLKKVISGAGNCNFLTDEITSAHNLNFASKFPPNNIFQPKLYIFGWKISDEKKIFRQFSDNLKFKGKYYCPFHPLATTPLLIYCVFVNVRGSGDGSLLFSAHLFTRIAYQGHRSKVKVALVFVRASIPWLPSDSTYVLIRAWRSCCFSICVIMDSCSTTCRGFALLSVAFIHPNLELKSGALPPFLGWSSPNFWLKLSPPFWAVFFLGKSFVKGADWKIGKSKK